MADRAYLTVDCPGRRWWQFGLRGLFSAVTILGAVLGFVVHTTTRQREALAIIRRAQGRIEFDFERLPSIPFEPRPARNRLQKLFGDDSFGHVSALSLRLRARAEITFTNSYWPVWQNLR